MTGSRGVIAKAAFTFLFVALAAGVSVAGPIVTFSPTSVDFGNQLVETVSPTRSITLTNTGDATLTITSIRPNPVGTFQQFNDCGNSLAAGASCTIRVQFAPTTSGQTLGNISVADNAPGSPQKALLKGTGTVPPAILKPTAVDFGALAVGTTSAAKTITLTNQGSTSLTFNNVSTSSSDFAATSNCPSQLGAGASCTISVTLNPSAGGTRIATLSVNDSDPSSPQIANLTGVGTSGTAALSPSTLTFASQQVGSRSAPQAVTLTNNGSTDLGIVTILTTGDYAQVSTCGTALAPGASCSLKVSFVPSSAGTRSGFITANDTDATNFQTVTITGTGFVKASTVTVQPKVASVTFSQTQQFQAFINGSPTTNVAWSVDGVAGGNPNVGTITKAGLYTPPHTIGTHLIRATSKADRTQIAIVPLVVTNVAGVFTYHNDNARTGQNLSETVLTTGNVNQDQFGKLFSFPVDGVMRGSPLYVANVKVPGQGFHNVVYAATEHDSVYAFDADGRVTTPLWQASFIDPANGVTTVPQEDVNLGCPGVGTEFGISGTPVIDPTTNRLFVIARTKDTSGGTPVYHQKLHALDLRSGAEVPGSPVEIQASVTGFGEGSSNGTLAFSSLHENSRPGLLLLNGVVYLAWSAICDFHPYHGWVMGYDANSLQQVSVFNTSPNGQAAGIWQSAAGLTGDNEGNIYFETSNGLFNVDSGGTEYGMSILKLSTSGGLSVADYFTPFNATDLTEIDADMTSHGTVVLPDQPTSPPRLLLGAGKEGFLYLLDRDNMGHFHPTDSRALQSVFMAGGCPTEGSLWGVPAYWQNHVYIWPCGDILRDFRFYQGLLSPRPVVVGTLHAQYPSPWPAVSSHGNANGILWALYEHNWVFSGPAILFAFDGANVSRQLYSTLDAGTRDQAGPASKGPVPIIVNGKVYVGTASELDVYGLLP
jgi:archaellum component FlaF (FlaF/FlaG flagellin family)